MYCAHCGAKNPDGSDYCFNCGGRIDTSPRESGVSATADGAVQSPRLVPLTASPEQRLPSGSSGSSGPLLFRSPQFLIFIAVVLSIGGWIIISGSRLMLLGCAMLVSSIAIWGELRSGRIPNWLTVPGFAAGIVLNAFFAGWTGLKSSLFGAALGLVLLLPFVLVRSLGAGALKLAGSLGAFVGPRLLIKLLLGSIVVAGVMALGIAVRRRPDRRPLTLPYGTGLALTVLLYGVATALGWVAG